MGGFGNTVCAYRTNSALYHKTGAEKAKYSYVGKSLQNSDVQDSGTSVREW